MDLAEQVGGRIRELRAARGLTQAALAEVIGVTPEQISRIERGTREPRFATLQRMADALGVRVADLFATERAKALPKPQLADADNALPPELASAIAQCARLLARAVDRSLRSRRRR